MVRMFASLHRIATDRSGSSPVESAAMAGLSICTVTFEVRQIGGMLSSLFHSLVITGWPAS